jgi:HSP20 family protein
VNYQIEELFQGLMLTSARAGTYRGGSGGDGRWRPAIDVYEADGALHVVAELAGVREDQISVALDEGILRIRGERSPVCDDPKRSVHAMGILYGPFAADIYLPFSVDHENVEATYENGMLRVQLTPVAPTQISVNYGEVQ